MTQMTQDITGQEKAPGAVRESGLHRLHALYPNHYCWFLLLSSMDVMLTHAILGPLKGRELNTVADIIISRFGLWGAIGLKFATVIIAIAVLEFVGRHRPQLGRRLAVVSICIAAVPVSWGMYLLGVGIAAGHHESPPAEVSVEPVGH